MPVEVRREPAKFEKTAVYFDCGKDALTIQPGGIVVSNFNVIALAETNSPVRQTLEYVQANADKMYLMVLQRPDSAKTFSAAYRSFYLRRITVAHELVEAGVPWDKATEQPGFTLGALARPLDRLPVMFECRSNELFYVTNNELGKRALQFLERYRPLSRRQDIELAERALGQAVFADEHYVLEGPAILDDIVRLRPRPGVPGDPIGNLADTSGKFLQRLRTLDFNRLFVQFLVRDDSFELVRRAREVAENEGFEWRIQLLAPGEPLEFQRR